jgi:uroporphyrinogen-III synthase
MKLLIIRPQPGNDASAARAKAAGFEPVQLPFFEVRPRIWEVPDVGNYDALLITSSNAVRHAGAALSRLSGLPVHAVGRVSANAASDAGLELASSGSKGAADAITAALAAGHRRLLWLAGEDRTQLAVAAEMLIDERIIYASEAATLQPDAPQIVARCPVVALHSARAARAFTAFVKANSLDQRTFVIAAFSPAIAEAAGPGWGGVAQAEHPEDAALLSAAARLVKQDRSTGKQGESG